MEKNLVSLEKHFVKSIYRIWLFSYDEDIMKEEICAKIKSVLKVILKWVSSEDLEICNGEGHTPTCLDWTKIQWWNFKNDSHKEKFENKYNTFNVLHETFFWKTKSEKSTWKFIVH